ncbi:hypothetical protein [Solilutibacter pythonis]|uniref:hypothetical protein n=1 Tax=Solilutibacter pythonis TaxID=2483112 RepID=UPI001313FD0B|nr:hypothetical protein [Lysobacter pythonis]
MIPGAPAFVNGWLNHRAAPRALANVKSLASAPEKLTDAWLSAIPTALFFLVPAFALLLRLAYPFAPWKYLEHLVVALYSHPFLLLAATVMLSRALLAQWTHWGWLARLNEIARLAGTAGGVVWLLATQWRVYRQPWWLTAPTFLAIGFVYSILVGLVALVALVTVFLK